jgi:hypothetical protein
MPKKKKEKKEKKNTILCFIPQLENFQALSIRWVFGPQLKIEWAPSSCYLKSYWQ